jgi:DUF438 domain-containing protein
MSKSWNELLMQDHETTERVLAAMEKAFAAPNGPPPAVIAKLHEYLRGYVDQCHTVKEEQHLFPLIEARGVPRNGGPLAVMLQEHEQARGILARLSPLAEAVVAGDGSKLDELRTTFSAYADLLKNHFWKENDILYPMALRVMTDTDGAVVVRGIEAAEAALGSGTRERYYRLADEIIAAGELQDLSLDVDRNVLATVLNTLPIELSFVDQTDTVRYFSHELSEKIFPRTRGAIGTKVQDCHPETSVHVVNEILADFKAGKRDVAEFWIAVGDRKIHIRYWPVRDPKGTYLGCLETVQDITAIQKLTGERRLLDSF